jgi:hypothetical protein
MTQRRYIDAEGNVYAVEKSSKTGRFIVTRTNSGGNRKLAKLFAETCGRPEHVQKTLDTEAHKLGWKEVEG